MEWLELGRAAGIFLFPARFTLVAAANPCPCGAYGSPGIQCHCQPGELRHYQNKISGPILDRIDIHIKVERENIDIFSKPNLGEEDAGRVGLRVARALQTQRQRFKDMDIFNNSELESRRLQEIFKISDKTKVLLRAASKTMNFSARSYFKLIRISQTIADLDGDDCILEKHLSEALQYRPFFGN